MKINISVHIKTEKANVWKWLTDPVKIKKYLFGTEVNSKWKIGSDIIFQGNWQGKGYKDKGKIIDLIPDEKLSYTYWSSFSGLPDMKENYNLITIELTPESKTTLLTLTQDNIQTKEAADHSKKNWIAVLGKLKEMLESTNQGD